MPKKFNFVPNIYNRFISRVNITDFKDNSCWNWKGGSKGNGYGSFNFKGKALPAHRAAYLLFVNSEIHEKMDICHSCDNRMCVNPDHLFQGTRKDNMVDMKSKGRGSGGYRKHIKESQVQEIKQRLNAGHQPRKISISMDINYSTITSIKRGDSYVSK